MRLHDYLEFWARIAPETVFAEFEGRSLSYGEAESQANRIAHALIDAGLQKGDRVAILAKNCTEYALFYYAAAKAGVAPVPLNYRLAPPEWSYIVNDSQAKLLIARGELAPAVDGVRGELAQVKHCVALGAEVPGWQDWDEFVAGKPDTAPERVVNSDDDLYQMYTSGTTGRPKGAVLSHRAVCSNIHQVGFRFGVETGQRGLVVAPLYHAAAGIMVYVTVAAGGTLVIQEDFVPGDAVRAMSDEGIHHALLVPAMIQFCLSAVPDARERSYDALRLIVYGASAISESVLRDGLETFGCDFMQGYGMTETTAVACLLSPDDHRRALSGEKPELLLSCGRPVLGSQVRIVGAGDAPVPTGEIGEILIRGPQLMQGYWNLEEASREALDGGWMHTGDAGRYDDEGYVYIQDRVKDMIVSGAENVYPREIEDVLFQHPGVADAAVIGVPDDQWGEVVKAIVVAKPDESVSADDIIEHCRTRLAGYKRPRSVDFIDELPRNPSGKILKKDLRAPYWEGRSRGVN